MKITWGAAQHGEPLLHAERRLDFRSLGTTSDGSLVVQFNGLWLGLDLEAAHFIGKTLLTRGGKKKLMVEL